MQWTVLATARDVALAAFRRIADAAAEAIATRGRFTIVLAGGTTPGRVYRMLADNDQDWQHWHVFLGDERCLPEGHADRNSSMIQHNLLDAAAIPAQQVHMIPAQLGAEPAAEQYAGIIANYLPFDLVLLGMGEDGHTASLFPGHHHPPDALVVPVHDAPKPPPERVSLSGRALGASRHLIILATGEAKQDAVSRWRQGITLPVNQIRAREAAEVLVDQPAWA
jgi:6-phosphogluconolactonase